MGIREAETNLVGLSGGDIKNSEVKIQSLVSSRSDSSSGEDSPIEGTASGGSGSGSPRARRASDENRRANACTGCAELRRLRRDNKRLEQELRESNNTRYAEEQRVLALLEQVDTKSREAVQLRQKVMHRSKSTFFENWFDVHIEGMTANKPKRGKSREMLWKKLYVVIRGGQMLLYNVSQERRTSYATPILTMDINCRMSVSKVKETDPEVIATNKDSRRMFRIDYMEPNNNRSSLGKRAATCEVSAAAKKTVLFEASTVEDKEQWMRMLSEEVAVSGVWYKKTALPSAPSSVKMQDFGCQTDEIVSSAPDILPVNALCVSVIVLALVLAYSWLKELAMGVLLS